MDAAISESRPFNERSDETTPPLPPSLRLLCVTSREPLWAGLSLRLHAAGCVSPSFHWVSTAHEVLEILRRESLDCILIHPDPTPFTAKDSMIDAETLLPAIRAAGCDDPMILLAETLSETAWAGAYTHACEAVVSSRGWESPVLLPAIAHAIQRVGLVRDHHRLTLITRRQLVRERDEAERLLTQQRQMIRDLEALTATAMPSDDVGNGPDVPTAKSSVTGGNVSTKAADCLPAEVRDAYQELLRTYVIMGSGSLGPDITRIAEIIALARMSPREVLQFHVERVEVLVGGLGSRSTRHVIARADLLALELMIRLGECYQQRLLCLEAGRD